MKNVFVFVFFIGLFTIVLPLHGYGQNLKESPERTSKVTEKSFVRGQFTDQNQDGICDHRELRPQNGRGRNFVDDNGDGMCDNPGYRKRGYGQGHGYCRKGQGFRSGSCRRGPGQPAESRLEETK